MMTVDIEEGDETAVPLRDLEEASGLGRQELTERLSGLVTLRPSFARGKSVLSAGRRVGSLSVGELKINVRPRLSQNELARLIRYAWKRDIAHGRTYVRTETEGLDELVGALLADEARSIQERGLSRRYEERTERMRTLRGRPKFAESFPWNDEGNSSQVCSYHLLTADNINNRLVRAALRRATLLDVSLETRRKLSRLHNIWQSVASEMSPTPADFLRARQRYDRLSEHYALAHRLGELILNGRRPHGLFDHDVASAGLSLDMASLFETFAERTLGEWIAASREDMHIRAQQSDAAALVDKQGDVYRRVRPDLIVYDESGQPIAVVDAKYKAYWAEDDTGTPVRKVSNADTYQLFFYAQRLQIRYGLAEAPKAFILAPLPAEDERTGQKTIDSRYRRISWRATSDETPGTLHLLFLPMTRLLRMPPLDWHAVLEKTFNPLR